MPFLRDRLKQGVVSFIWAAGYQFDFSLVRLPLFDGDGFPIQQDGATGDAGLYLAGLPWLSSMKSGLLVGVGEDARRIAASIAARK